jgi:hypothetical protein
LWVITLAAEVASRDQQKEAREVNEGGKVALCNILALETIN